MSASSKKFEQLSTPFNRIESAASLLYYLLNQDNLDSDVRLFFDTTEQRFGFKYDEKFMRTVSVNALQDSGFLTDDLDNVIRYCQDENFTLFFKNFWYNFAGEFFFESPRTLMQTLAWVDYFPKYFNKIICSLLHCQELRVELVTFSTRTFIKIIYHELSVVFDSKNFTQENLTAVLDLLHKN